MAGKRTLPLGGRDAAAIEDFVARVRIALGDNLLDLRLFGSKATGRDTVESDIDILVIVDEATVTIEDSVLAIAFDVNLAHDVYISPRVVERAILQHPVWSGTLFVRTAIRDGIALLAPRLTRSLAGACPVRGRLSKRASTC